jgi:parallel beta-helix repeat protein
VDSHFSGGKMRRRANLKTVLMVSMFLLTMVCSAGGGVIYVDADANGIGDGTNWTDAYNYLQDALADANTSVKPIEIHVAEGVYTPDSNSTDPNGSGDRTATFQLISGVTLKGGYAGFGKTDPNARDIQLYETILSGDLAGNDADVNEVHDFSSDPCRSENSYHVVTGSGTDTNAVLGGFTICSGKAGGLYNYEGDPTIINCTFSANSYAAMFNYHSTSILIGCRFIRNAGGGIRNDESDSTIENCVFQENGGNGIYNKDSNPKVTNCIFIGNRGIYGGGMWNDGGNPIVSGCLFTDNRVSKYGGAILNEGSLRISNCEFFGNSADIGGGIFNRSNLRISNCTFVGNRWTGICNDGFTQTSNCIFWGNRPYQLLDPPELFIVTYSNVQDSWPGEGNIDIDPCFVELGYWDDPCNTPDQDWDDIWIEGDYHLKSQAGRWDANSQIWVQDDVTSPCIDAGDWMSPVGLEPFPNGGIINMGAYGGTAEASKSYFGKPVCEIIVAGDVNGDCRVNFLDFRIMALHWLEDNNPSSQPPPPPPPPG